MLSDKTKNEREIEAEYHRRCREYKDLDYIKPYDILMPWLKETHLELTRSLKERDRLSSIVDETTRFQRFSKWMQENGVWLALLGNAIAWIYNTL